MCSNCSCATRWALITGEFSRHEETYKVECEESVDVSAIHGKEKMDATLAMANIVNTLALILVNLVVTTAITRTLQNMHPVSADSFQHQNHRFCKSVENGLKHQFIPISNVISNAGKNDSLTVFAFPTTARCDLRRDWDESPMDHKLLECKVCGHEMYNFACTRCGLRVCMFRK